MRTGKKTYNSRRTNVVEPLLSGIVLGLIPVTLAGLFFAAYMQYKRGDQLGINK
jgi:cytochrome b6-f complex subunit 5